MTRLTEWAVVDVSEIPPPPPKCPVGMLRHKWVLSIEEGQPTISLADGEVCVRHDFGAGHESNVCEEDLAGYRCNDPDALEMPPVPVTLAIHVERTHDEVYGWLEAVPS